MRKAFVFAGVLGAVISTSGLAFADQADQTQTDQAKPAMQMQTDQDLTYVKKLTATTIKSALRLAGDLQTTSTCMDAKFTAENGQYRAIEFRRPGTEGQACGQIVMYKHVTTEFPDVQASRVIVEAKGYDVVVHQ